MVVKLMILNDKLCCVAKQMQLQFTLKGQIVSHEEVFASNGLLPGLAKRAEDVSHLSLGYGLGAKYEESEGTLLGKSVFFDEFTPVFLRVLCIVDVLEGLAKMGSDRHVLSMDELLYD